LVLCTGGGKTLCYQMVAALSPPGSLTVVVSPLISLMEDQLRRLPPQLPGACLASNLSMQDMARCACHGKQLPCYPPYDAHVTVRPRTPSPHLALANAQDAAGPACGAPARAVPVPREALQPLLPPPGDVAARSLPTRGTGLHRRGSLHLALVAQLQVRSKGRSPLNYLPAYTVTCASQAGLPPTGQERQGVHQAPRGAGHDCYR
jgi:hypothetical protein